MLDVVLNEKELIDNALKEKILYKNPIISLKAVIKEFYINEEITDKLELKEKLLELIRDILKDDYKRIKWESLVASLIINYLKAINNNRNGELIIYDVKEINITENELEIISELKDNKLEKMAFIMLVYAKINIIKINEGEKKQEDKNKKKNKETLLKMYGWINTSCTTICKEAKVGYKGVEKQRIFNEFYKKEYIDLPKSNTKTSIKVNYLDLNKESKIGLVIKDFNEVIYQYLIWKGEKWKRCEECDKWIKLKNKERTKYCHLCKDKLQKEWQKESMKKIRNT